MDINPQRVRTVEFSTARKGLDPDEVRSFLSEVADELERAQNQATAMEARARAAVSRLQQLTDDNDVSGEVAASAPTAPNTVTSPAVPAEAAPLAAAVDAAPVEPIVASVDESETISRTMLLAQRAADLAVAEAEAEAARVREEADEAATALIEQAKTDARTAGESERGVVESAVNALIARRDFLESDVDHMEQFLVDQRTRLRDAATAMINIAERVPGGLGEVRRPLLSASDDSVDEPQDATMPHERPLDDVDGTTDTTDDLDNTDTTDNVDNVDNDDAASTVAAADDAAAPASPSVSPPVMRLGFDDA